ncbi:MAG: trk system potassium uptake protein TrkH [Natronomonas sp.]|jgi:trk system potassium uptake protein TrkH|uniref:TrkH family potassium uptake protein n=1 Tax=Natronomonas sp. TaxID=2184060 RepID=UPI0039895CEF
MGRTRTQDLRTVVRDVGSLLLIEALVMTVSFGVALLFREWYAALAFLISGGITAGVGGLSRWRFLDAPAPLMKHGMVIAAAGWFATAVFGTLPFLLTAHLTPPEVAAATATAAGFETSSLRYFRHPLHAMFESMSGWTGSGLTMAVHEPTLPRTLQWWRSVIQWVGGVGVIVLTVAILARPGSGSYTLYKSEARERKIHPSIVSTVRTVWKIFFLYTVICIAVLFVAIRMSAYGSNLTLFEASWQALNHAMTGLATGGFSVTDNSIGTYNSPLIEGALLPMMTLGAIAFPIHYAMLSEGDPTELFDDLQTRWLFTLLAGGVVLLSLQNVLFIEQTGVLGRGVDLPAWLAPIVTPAEADAVRDASFQFISALTCTGFQSSPIGNWSNGGKLIISGAMVLGGAAGSTVGGIKIIRGYIIAKGIRWQFSRVFLPASAVATAKVGDRKLSRDQMTREFSEAAIVGVLWLSLLAASSLVLVNLAGADFTYADALFEVASAQGNVGLSTGIVGPSMHPLAEAMFVLNMWIGRLEIIPVLVFGRALLYGFRP